MGFISELGSKLRSKPPTPSMPQKKDVLNALSKVIDPDLKRDLVSLGFVHDIQIEGHQVRVRINLTTPACPVKDEIKQEAVDRLNEIPGVKNPLITLSFDSPKLKPRAVTQNDSKPDQSGLNRIDHILAIASGKGGVGKSTTSVQLARCLADAGAKVGILDADIYGPSIPHLTKVLNPNQMNGNLVIPPQKGGIKMISVSMFASSQKAQILRGPMAANMVKQFLTQVDWGPLDYLIIDYPPGTGDIQLTISQIASLSAAILVTTPQETSLIDVRKAFHMFQTVKTPVLGIIETMSYFLCDGCDKKHFIFSQHGGSKLSQELQIPLLGQIPIQTKISESSEQDLSKKLFPEYKTIGHEIIRKLSILKAQNSIGLDKFQLSWRKS